MKTKILVAVLIILSAAGGMFIGKTAATIANQRDQERLAQKNFAVEEKTEAPVQSQELKNDNPPATPKTTKTNKEVQDSKTKQLVDVKKILNKIPEEVEKVVGEPDHGYSITTWHDINGRQYPAKKAYYKNGLLEAFYIKDTLVRLSIEPEPPLGLTAKALEAIGLPTEASPASSSSHQMNWKGLHGYYEVSVNKTFIHIITSERYR